ncbi:MAG: HD domain-containing protein [Verrucomicrobia bacterium]|nr:HD domain-containing protein [Verrucomicrobiota bacterium]
MNSAESKRSTIEELKRSGGSAQEPRTLHAQIETLLVKLTREQKPYLQLSVRDEAASFSLRVWDDHPAYGFVSELRTGDFIAINAEFVASPSYGLEARNWSVRLLTGEERADLLAGSLELQEKQSADFDFIVNSLHSIADPRLRRLSLSFVEEFGERFRRTAGARNYHHARRGGLVEHVAQMMRSATALAGVYPYLHRDLLITGILFHDAGKLWENSFSKDSFVMQHELAGELVGHISISVEILNRLWQKLRVLPEYSSTTDSEAVRLHLIHLIVSHHGEKQFGSPIEPKTPEAMALHIIDNLDAKLEMMKSAYETGNRLTPQIVERIRPLTTNLVQPLFCFAAEVLPSDNKEERPNC